MLVIIYTSNKPVKNEWKQLPWLYSVNVFSHGFTRFVLHIYTCIGLYQSPQSKMRSKHFCKMLCQFSRLQQYFSWLLFLRSQLMMIISLEKIYVSRELAVICVLHSAHVVSSIIQPRFYILWLFQIPTLYRKVLITNDEQKQNFHVSLVHAAGMHNTGNQGGR